MANTAIDHAVRTIAWPRFRIAKRWRVFQRCWRREQLRRQALRQLLAEIHDPRIFADIGFAVPPGSIEERWAAAMFHHRQ